MRIHLRIDREFIYEKPNKNILYDISNLVISYVNPIIPYTYYIVPYNIIEDLNSGDIGISHPTDDEIGGHCCYYNMERYYPELSDESIVKIYNAYKNHKCYLDNKTLSLGIDEFTNIMEIDVHDIDFRGIFMLNLGPDHLAKYKDAFVVITKYGPDMFHMESNFKLLYPNHDPDNILSYVYTHMVSYKANIDNNGDVESIDVVDLDNDIYDNIDDDYPKLSQDALLKLYKQSLKIKYNLPFTRDEFLDLIGCSYDDIDWGDMKLKE